MRSRLQAVAMITVAFFLIIALVWKLLTYVVLKDNYHADNVYDLRLRSGGIFSSANHNILVFNNHLPARHRSGLEVIMYSERIATNGNLYLRNDSLDIWMPAVLKEKRIDKESNAIYTGLYLEGSPVAANLTIKPVGQTLTIRLDLTKPLPRELDGNLQFRIDLYPPAFDGKSFIMDDRPGIISELSAGSSNRQEGYSSEGLLAEGSSLILSPEDPVTKIIFRQERRVFSLYYPQIGDRANWLTLCTDIPRQAGTNALYWEISLNQLPRWSGKPVLLYARNGYHPDLKKRMLIGLPTELSDVPDLVLRKRTPDGKTIRIKTPDPVPAGWYANTYYYGFDFTGVRESGVYFVTTGDEEMPSFRIGRNIFPAQYWITSLTGFLPSAMTGLQIRNGEVTRQYDSDQGFRNNGGPQSGDNYNRQTGIDGNYRTQADVTFWLSLCNEFFKTPIDEIRYDVSGQSVWLKTPDGIPDILQLIEYGARYLIRERSYNADYPAIRALASASKALQPVNPDLSDRCRTTAIRLWDSLDQYENENTDEAVSPEYMHEKFNAAAGLVVLTREEQYKMALRNLLAGIRQDPLAAAPSFCRVVEFMDPGFRKNYKAMTSLFLDSLQDKIRQNPFRIPFDLRAGGISSDLLVFAADLICLRQVFPDRVDIENIFGAVDYILGVHPVSNSTLISGPAWNVTAVPAEAAGYGASVTPGGLIRGPVLINPDFAEFREDQSTFNFEMEYSLEGTAAWIFCMQGVDALLK